MSMKWTIMASFVLASILVGSYCMPCKLPSGRYNLGSSSDEEETSPPQRSKGEIDGSMHQMFPPYTSDEEHGEDYKDVKDRYANFPFGPKYVSPGRDHILVPQRWPTGHSIDYWKTSDETELYSPPPPRGSVEANRALIKAKSKGSVSTSGHQDYCTEGEEDRESPSYDTIQENNKYESRARKAPRSSRFKNVFRD